MSRTDRSAAGKRRGVGAHAARLAVVSAMAAAGWAAAGWADPAEAQTTPRIAINGSQIVGDVLTPALVEGFGRSLGYRVERSQTPGADRQSLRGAADGGVGFVVTLEQLGAERGLRDLAEGRADLAMAARPARPAELAALDARVGAPLAAIDSQHVIALEGVAIVVAPDHPLDSIGVDVVARIFGGDVVDWSELGLPAGPIRVYAPSPTTSAFDLFNRLALTPYGRTLRRDAVRELSPQRVADAVAADPRAIGVVAIGSVGSSKALDLDLGCGVIAPAAAFTVRAEEYPLRRRLHLFSLGAPENLAARAFLAYAVSDEAQIVVAEAGFIDIAPMAQNRADFADRLIGAIALARSDDERALVRRFIDATAEAERLSTTFRFTGAGEQLDAKSIAEAGRLARWLEAPENAEARIVLFGFSDATDDLAAGEALSLARAQAVRRAVLIQVSFDFDPARVETAGFASIAPVACNDTEAGRSGNRRVEVWVMR